MDDSTHKVMVIVPIRDATGNLHLRQCKPKLHYERYISLNRRNIPTTHDIESRLRHNLRLIRITKGL